MMERNAPMILYPAIHKVIKKLFKIQEERKATIFFEIYGHVQQISVRIYKGEWEPDKDPSFSDNLYIDSSLEDNIKYVEDFVNSIDNYINNHL